MAYFWRDNDAADLPWHGPTWIERQMSWAAISLIESNFVGASRVGDLAAIAVQKGPLDAWGTLWDVAGHRDGKWFFTPLLADGRPVDHVIGPPALIQGTSGRRGNYEMLVPLVGGLAHFWRDNDAAGTPWHGPIWVIHYVAVRGGSPTAIPAWAALIQSSWGYLEAVVVRS